MSDGTTDEELTEATATAILAGFFGVPLLYMWFFGVTGQTIGMMILDMRVVSATGGAPSVVTAFVRSLVLIIGASFVVGCLWPMWDRDRETLHDKASQTRVVPIG